MVMMMAVVTKNDNNDDHDDSHTNKALTMECDIVH